MALNKAAVRAEVMRAAQAIMNDLAQSTIDYARPVHNVDTGFMRGTSKAIEVNSPEGEAITQRLPDRTGAVVTRRAAATPATDELTSIAAVPAVYAFPQEMVNPALGPAADQVLSEAASIVARHQL